MVAPVGTKLLLVYSAFPGRRISLPGTRVPLYGKWKKRAKTVSVWFQKTPPDSGAEGRKEL